MTSYATPGSRRGELFEAVLSRESEVGQIKNVFSLILRSTCHFSCGLHDGVRTSRLRIFKEKRRNLLEWLKRKNLSIFTSVFQTNVRMMRTRMDFFFLQKNERNISSA